MPTKKQTYVVYRYGANGANQSGVHRAPVAIVEARTAREACETRPCMPGTLYATEELILAHGVHAYSNQSFRARSLVRVPQRHIDQVQELDELCPTCPRCHE